MKLYTEEQLVRAMSLAVYNKYEKYMEVLDLLTPIELPSDEEIDKFAQIASSIRKEKSKGEWIAYKSLIAGAKWVIEHIKNNAR